MKLINPIIKPPSHSFMAGQAQLWKMSVATYSHSHDYVLACTVIACNPRSGTGIKIALDKEFLSLKFSRGIACLFFLQLLVKLIVYRALCEKDSQHPSQSELKLAARLSPRFFLIYKVEMSYV